MKQNNQYSSKIKELRNELGLTMRQAGDILGVTERSYANFENGIRNIKPWEYLGIVEILKSGGKNVQCK